MNSLSSEAGIKAQLQGRNKGIRPWFTEQTRPCVVATLTDFGRMTPMLQKLLKSLYVKLPIIRELRAIQALQRDQQTVYAGIADRAIRDIHRLFDPAFREDSSLLAYESQVNSQNGEDGIISEIFRRIGVTNKVCVEIGAGDGVENNSAMLAALGWHVFMIDGKFASGMRAARAHKYAPTCTLVGAQVTQASVDTLLQELNVSTEPDLVSIDIDQNTYHVWRGMSAVRPRVVVAEYNSNFPPGVKWVPHYDPDRCWDGSINYSASLGALCILGRDKGYSLVGCDFLGINAFFVRSDLVAERFLPPFTAEKHYQPPRYWLMSRWSHRRSALDANAFQEHDETAGSPRNDGALTR
jgi:hypothetical protein